MDFILKKILFASPPFTLAQSLGPTPPPSAKILRKMASITWSGLVGIVGYANMVAWPAIT